MVIVAQAAPLCDTPLAGDYDGDGICDPTIYISPSEGVFPSNMVALADANLVVRDGWAGCYYHWFWGTNYLPDLITGLTNLGYQFTTIDPDME